MVDCAIAADADADAAGIAGTAEAMSKDVEMRAARNMVMPLR
jgi:hypothetical protein